MDYLSYRSNYFIPVWKIIDSLKLVDYLFVQAGITTIYMYKIIEP